MDKPEVTPEMLEAAQEAFGKTSGLSDELTFTAIYRAMRLARPLSEGPGV